MKAISQLVVLAVLAAVFLTWLVCSQQGSLPPPQPPLSRQPPYPFQDPSLPIEERVTNIVSLMTLEEKIAALGTNPSVPGLGITGSDHVEGLHGVALGGPGGWGGASPVPTTQFPQAVGLGETWDPDVVRLAAAAEGEEARYLFQSSRYRRGGLVIRAPNADLNRDPRWGRSEESYGEDPFLNGTMAVAFVKGLQGDDPRYWQAASLLKHFMANSNEDGRGSSSSDFDERLLREYYSVPFRMGIVEGGARAFMAAYNAVNGMPMTVHPVLRNMVMREWGFDGIICTDAGAMTNLVTEHHYYSRMDQAAAGAVHAGINQFLDNYSQAVRDALRNGLLTERDIDEALKAVFRVMIRLGLLDPPTMVPYASIGGGPEPWLQNDRMLLARTVTQKSVVLLKNENNLLPLDKSALRSIAVIGPYANQVPLDWYSGAPPYTVSPLEGIRRAVGSGVTVTFVANNNGDAAAQAARTADVAIVVVGNHPTCDARWAVCPLPSDGKEAIDRKSIALEQEALVQQVYAANPRTIVVLRASFPFAINWTQENVSAILHMAHNSQEEGNALADVLFGDFNPGGRLVDTWPKSISQLPPMMDYNIRNGRTYMYFQGEPLYPFGYGLSYTTFQYSNLRTSSSSIPANGAITISVDITNTGGRAGDEVVQMYVKHPQSQVARPAKELRGFKRITLQPGERKTVDFALSGQALAYFDEARARFVVEVAPVIVQIGSSSADIRLEGTVPVTP
jgi:beta-glucosidase